MQPGRKQHLWQIVLISLVMGWATNAWPERVGVACGSSLLASLVYDLLGDEALVLVLISPTAHLTQPQQLDSAMLKSLAQARLLIYHPFQSRLIRELEEKDLENLIREPLRNNYHLTVPPEYLRAAQDVRAILTGYFPEYTTYLEERLTNLCEQVALQEKELLAQAREAKLTNCSCLCSWYQKEFAAWLGLKVLATFQDAETITSAKLAELKQTAQSQRIWLVLGNNQGTGPEAAQKVAEAIYGQAVILAHEPAFLEEDGKAGWHFLLQDNVRSLLDVMARQDNVSPTF